jgi:hypothetical protein
MAAKKNTTHVTSFKTPKVHPRKGGAIENLPTEASASADVVLTQAAEAPASPRVAAEAAETTVDPMAEASRIVTPTPAAAATTATADHPPEPTAPARKLSALDAAAKVLGETGRSMSCQELITAMAAKGYWSSPKGRTPASTLYSSILRELQTQGEQARFVKTERGRFARRGAV